MTPFRPGLAFALAFAALACTTVVPIDNRDPRSPEISRIERLSSGPYLAGQTERFRVVYAAEAAPLVHWSASAGEVASDGDEVAWTLPDAEEASLSVGLHLPTRAVTASFHFRLTGATPATAAAPAGTVDSGKDSTGYACDLAFNPSGNPVIAYTNQTHPSIWLATWSGSAWQTELVDGMGYETGGQAGTGAAPPAPA